MIFYENINEKSNNKLNKSINTEETEKITITLTSPKTCASVSQISSSVLSNLQTTCRLFEQF